MLPFTTMSLAVSYLKAVDSSLFNGIKKKGIYACQGNCSDINLNSVLRKSPVLINNRGYLIIKSILCLNLFNPTISAFTCWDCDFHGRKSKKSITSILLFLTKYFKHLMRTVINTLLAFHFDDDLPIQFVLNH